MFSKSFIFLSSSWVLETRRESKRGREMKEEKLSLYHKIAWAALLLELEALFSLASAEGQGDEPSIPQAPGREWQNLEGLGSLLILRFSSDFPNGPHLTEVTSFAWEEGHGLLASLGRPWGISSAPIGRHNWFLSTAGSLKWKLVAHFQGLIQWLTRGGRTKRMAPVCINTAVQLCLHWNIRNRSPPGEHKRQGGYSTTHRSFSWDSWTTTWRERVRLLPYSWLLVI